MPAGAIASLLMAVVAVPLKWFLIHTCGELMLLTSSTIFFLLHCKQAGTPKLLPATHDAMI